MHFFILIILVHLRYSLFPANTILKMLLVTQFAYFASLQKPPFEEFSCVLLFLLRLWRLLLVADNQCTEGSLIPGDQGYYIPHPLPYPGYPSTTGDTTLLHTPGLHMCTNIQQIDLYKPNPKNQICQKCNLLNICSFFLQWSWSKVGSIPSLTLRYGGDKRRGDKSWKMTHQKSAT